MTATRSRHRDMPFARRPEQRYTASMSEPPSAASSSPQGGAVIPPIAAETVPSLADTEMPGSAPSAAPAPERRLSLAELFFGFASAGLSGFGGVMPFARRMIVEDRRWMTDLEFAEVLGLGQFLPGPNIVNVSVLIGSRYNGWLGSVAAFLGLMLPPFVISIILGILYARYGHLPLVQHVFTGITAAASGLLLGTAGKLARPLLRRPPAIVFLVLAFVAIALLRYPLLAVLVVLAPFSVLAAWPWRKAP
jgi:chromate transporter